MTVLVLVISNLFFNFANSKNPKNERKFRRTKSCQVQSKPSAKSQGYRSLPNLAKYETRGATIAKWGQVILEEFRFGRPPRNLRIRTICLISRCNQVFSEI